MKCFTQETLEADEADDKVQLTPLKRGWCLESSWSHSKNPPKTMAEMLLKAQEYMNVEDALTAIKDMEKPGDKGRKENNCRGWKRECSDR